MKKPIKITPRSSENFQPAAHPPPQGAPKRPFVTLSKRQFVIALGAVLVLSALPAGLVYQVHKSGKPRGLTAPPTSGPGESLTGNALGIDYSLYSIEKDVCAADQPIAEFLRRQNLPDPVFRELMQQADAIGLERMERGHETAVLKPSTGDAANRLFLYEISSNKRAVFRLYPLPKLDVILEEVTTHICQAGGVITTTLWEAVLDYNIHYDVIGQMEEAMKWSVDFYHLAPGDKFKVIYEEKRAGNEVIEIGRVKAVYFKTGGEEHFAFWLDSVATPGFYDAGAKPVRRTFLKCPVKYERITSKYGLRVHPVTLELKEHLGTDFGAPEGSPIFATGDGVVEVAGKNAFNGNFIKIKHDNVFKTQYLHMERFEESIRPGVRVKQGQIIGFVGQTGQATGPHVCYRFWKDGEQVDPLEEPAQKPFLMSLKDQDRFDALKIAVEQQLREIVYFDWKL